jgi:Family of unknown function (DUF5995)
MAPVGTIDEVVARLQRLESELPVSDGVHWFNRLYLEVTLAVRDYLAHNAVKAPPFLEQLDVFFGNKYFAAVDGAGGRPPRVATAWMPLFDARHDSRIAPLQFALAGMNAHVNHDLAVGVVQICEALHMEPGDPQHQDYDAISTIVTGTEKRVKRWLLTGAIKELDHAVAPADDLAAIWSITAARDAAWARAQVLWRLRDEAELTSTYLAVNERATELAGRAMLLPLPLA